jgi:hypothetical protein
MARTVTAVAAVLLAAVTLSAGEPAAKKPLGTWERTKDDTKYQFKITADAMHFTADGPSGKLELDADFAVTKEGHLFGRIRKIKEGAGPQAGDLFGFAFTVKGDTLTITDWRGSGAAGLAQFLQGDYKKVEGK